MKLYIKYISLIIIFILLAFLINKIFLNGYIGINKKPCLYCKLFPGKHFHYLSPTKIVWAENFKSDQHMCHICVQYPGQYHFHKHF